MDTLTLHSPLALNRSQIKPNGRSSVDQLLKSTKKMKLKVVVLFELLKKDKKTQKVLEVLEEEIAHHQNELTRLNFLEEKAERSELSLTTILANDIVDHASHLAEVNVKITGDIRSRLKGDFEMLSFYLSHLLGYIKKYLSIEEIHIDVYRSQGYVKLDFKVLLPLMLDDKMLDITDHVMKVHFGKQSWLGGKH